MPGWIVAQISRDLVAATFFPRAGGRHGRDGNEICVNAASRVAPGRPEEQNERLGRTSDRVFQRSLVDDPTGYIPPSMAPTPSSRRSNFQSTPGHSRDNRRRLTWPGLSPLISQLGGTAVCIRKDHTLLSTSEWLIDYSLSLSAPTGGLSFAYDSTRVELVRALTCTEIQVDAV